MRIYLKLMACFICLLLSIGAKARTLSVDSMPLVAQTSYDYIQQYAGRIRSRHITELGFEIGTGRTGTLTTIQVDVGDKFKKGQVLAQLDTGLQQQRLIQLNAQLKQAQANLSLAKATTRRLASLQLRNHASKQAMDEANTKEQGVIWQIKALDAQIKQANLILKKYTLVAPFNGVVTARYLSQGALVQSGQRVLQVLDDTAYQVNIGVPVRYLSKLNVGQQVKIKVDDTLLVGEIKSINSQRNPVTQSHNVLIVTKVKQGLFIPNQALATIDLSVNIKQEGFWVPISALQQSYRGLWALYGLKAQGENQYVVTKHHAKIYFANQEKAFISTDLKAGDLIVKDGLLRIVPGETVTVKDGAK